MKGTTLRTLRQWHHYIGVFLAPAVLFFAFSGLIQVLGWQDQRNPPPAAWVSTIAGIHKHQMLPKPRPAEPARKPATARSAGDDDHDHGGLAPLKIFALLVAIGLFTTTLIGLTIALGTRNLRRPALIALGLGIVVPVALLIV
ncbi:hypothetical protein [Sphingomonas pruni]|uniref:hypothetical protein n=1 Tax=Sphingomonas pruni TaxID=40683 RepID=UPI0008378C33|nr:hypothetical protein [Sphingomonas pruni]